VGGLIDSALPSTRHLQPTSHHPSLCTAFVNILILFFSARIQAQVLLFAFV